MVGKRFRIALSALLILGSLSGGLNFPSVQAESSVSVIHWNEERQRVDGFGGSGAFGKAGNVMRLEEPIRTKVLDMIFSQEKGIGISILRNLVGDGVAAETIEPQPGVFVWDDSEWETKKVNFDKYQIWYMNEAKKRGVTTFFSSVWSPPAWMKTNGSVAGAGNGKLKPENYQDFADYLTEYVLGYKKHFDLDISYISITNEPTTAASYSGTIWTPDELNIFIRDYLGPTFKKRNVPAKIVMPEHENFTEKHALPALNDTVTVNYIDVIASHAYGIGIDVPTFPVSTEKGKTIWQTEYMNQGESKQTYEYNTMRDALRYANLIGDMFDITGISAYFWWWPVASNGADGSDLIRLVTDGTSKENGLFRVFKRYYSFGNYSRFIRPGYVMIDTGKNPSKDVIVKAYKDPGSGNFAIIVINNSPDDQKLTLQLNQFPGGVNELVPYRTSPNENMKKLGPVNVTGNTATVELRSSSVTTYIPKSFELPELAAMKDVFSTYEAEENDGQSAGLVTDKNVAGKSYLTHVKNGDYIKYGNLNFADGTANGTVDKLHMLAMNAVVSSQAGGTIEVRLDDPVSGKVVGTMAVPASSDPERWLTVSTMIDTNPTDGAYGYHDMYLVFKGESIGQLFKVDVFSFGDSIPVIVEPTKTVYDFEDNTVQGWVGRASANVVTVSQEHAHSGQLSLKTTNRTSTWHGPTTPLTNKIVKGTDYDISSYVRLTDAPSKPDTVKLTMEVNEFGKTTYNSIASASVADTQWVQLKGRFTSITDVSALKLYVESSNATASYYIDDIVIEPVSSNATLSGITLSEGVLSPEFSAGVTSYNASVGYSATDITVTPVTADTQATVKVNGLDVMNGQSSVPVSLNVGQNTITVIVTAKNGTTKTYTIDVIREAAGNTNLPMIRDITMDPSTFTNQKVMVTAQFDGNGSAIVSKKWAPGQKSVDYFATGGTTIPDQDFTVDSNGTYTMYAKNAFHRETVITFDVTNIDVLAPISSLSIVPEETNGQSGWYNTPVTIRLNAQDDLSGVTQVTYSINGGSQITYSGPFTLDKDGSYQIDYCSVDRAGNTEETQTFQINMDKTAPIFQLSLDSNAIWPPNHKMVPVQANLAYSDAGSGIATVKLLSISSNEPDEGLGEGDLPGDVQGAEFGTMDTQFSVRTERSAAGTGRVYSITYEVTDVAGNTTRQKVDITVSHDMSNKNK
jgi:glucuronoarabinoxylan endo-1,4-beta-xylanase